jgi:hypothetical protein
MTGPAGLSAEVGMGAFRFESEQILLPSGAWARAHRRILSRDGRAILGLSQGPHRAYLFPLLTPAGFAVTAESPADHPHHNSVWFAADHVHCRVPTGDDRFEEYTYNLYVDQTFQGRAPGTIIERAVTSEPNGTGGFEIVQTLDWQGPAEWGAPGGRRIASERRTIAVTPGATFHVVDLASELTPTDWDLAIGPTRHAYFNLRVVDSIAVTRGGRVVDSGGRCGGEAITGKTPSWVDYAGPVGGGHLAGVAVCPDPPEDAGWWFVTDWGVVTLSPFRWHQAVIARGERLERRVRLIVHDGDAESVDVAALHRSFLEERGR